MEILVLTKMKENILCPEISNFQEHIKTATLLCDRMFD